MTDKRDPEVVVTPDMLPPGQMFETSSGKYTWVYEMPMTKSFFLLFEVWKVFALSGAIIFAFFCIVDLVQGNTLNAILSDLGIIALTVGILLILSIPAYYLVIKANNGKYTVVFEMDDDGIDHTQIKTDKAKALEILTMGMGIMHGNKTAFSSGMLSASGSSLYSKFSKERSIKAIRKDQIIKVNGTFLKNQIYVEDKYFDFVLKYICDRCPNAKITD